MMAEQDNLAIVQQTYAAFGQGDMATVMSNLAPEIVWHSRYVPGVPLHGTFNGKDEVLQFFASLGSALEVHDFAPQKFIAQDDTVVVLGYEQVVAKPTGKAYKNEWVHVWTLKDGKVATVQASNNTAAAAAAFAS
ncbi:MAG: nuclear transport factor 2 family protein [Leptolyngbyaceae cyanobacterium bins.302]|nr:nuclear transport factor 2 family protein [Leptolyngbyaceae cyanobacterium bins.302]